MRYISTRGQAPKLDFKNVLLAGLANDGGLYVPETLPSWDAQFFRELKGKSYEEIAFAVIKPFVDGCFDDQELKALIYKTYASFGHISRAPLVQLGTDEWLCKLHYGPTLAFKDFAMQLIGNFYTTVLSRHNERLTIIGATSGDTGSAAIEAFKNLPNVNVFILFPKGRVSPVQQRQMTTSGANNVFPIAIDGDFDDCQALVKASFNDHEFRDAIRLGGVNSINWGRIMAQIVYYVSTAIALGAPERKVSFSVPTGNFGDIYAGYLAREMGLGIDRLIIATNQNDILHRTLINGEHRIETVRPSISPSMDIQISSNFERLLFDLYDRNAKPLTELMHALSQNGGFQIDDAPLNKLREKFFSARVSEDKTLAEIKRVYHDSGELICPHTAVGTFAARSMRGSSPVVTLATAHAAKFPEAVHKASGIYPELPPHMANLFEREEKFEQMNNDHAELKAYVRENCR